MAAHQEEEESNVDDDESYGRNSVFRRGKIGKLFTWVQIRRRSLSLFFISILLHSHPVPPLSFRIHLVARPVRFNDYEKLCCEYLNISYSLEKKRARIRTSGCLNLLDVV